MKLILWPDYGHYRLIRGGRWDYFKRFACESGRFEVPTQGGYLSPGFRLLLEVR
jgi:hypothetical protein